VRNPGRTSGATRRDFLQSTLSAARRETPAVALEADRGRAIALAPFEVITLEAKV
jgi:hypothetical protein